MADNQHISGFRPVKPRYGPSCIEPKYVHVATGYQATNDGAGFSVDLNIGDPVKKVNDGSVALALTTETVLGVIVCIKQYWDGTRLRRDVDRVPGATAWGTVWSRRTIVGIVYASDCYFEIDADSTGAPSTFATWESDRGLNATHTCPGDQTDTSKPFADAHLDISTAATTAALEWQIMEISKTAENKDETGANWKLIVTGNLTQEAGAAATPASGV